jgi:hypothetical protein
LPNVKNLVGDPGLHTSSVFSLGKVMGQVFRFSK